MKSKEEIEQLAFKSYGDTLLKGSFIHGYNQCQQDMTDNFLSLIEEYREKELPNRNIAYHCEAEISSGLNFLIEFIKNKKD